MPTPAAVDSPADPYAALNPEQRRAVEHGLGDAAGLAAAGSGAAPLLVIAGAGSGKTSMLAHRVARLLQAGADPRAILLLSFSRRAALDLERRVGQVLQQVLHRPGAGRGMPRLPPPSLPWAGTFHAIGARLLRDYAPRIGLDPGFAVLDRADAEELMGLVRTAQGHADAAPGRVRFPLKATCLSIYSRVVNSSEPLAQVLGAAYPWCAAHEAALRGLFAGYTEAKQRQRLLDYDDLLLLWAAMVGDATLAAEIGARFAHVLVDEYQDTNPLQADILRAIKPDGCGLTAVGDDAQAIYSFRAATVRNILDFPRAFTQPAQLITLERNYRSTQPILEASNAVIAHAAERFAKTLWTDRSSSLRPALVAVGDEIEQARWVADHVLEQREQGLALKQQAVLFRTTQHSTALELELARRHIPFVKFGGLRFLEAAHVKDLLAVLRLAHNPRHRLAGARALQLLPGIGPARAARLLSAMEGAPDVPAVLRAFRPPAGAAADWQAFVALLDALRATPEGDWPADFERARRWYLPHLERLHDDHRARALDLDQLAALAGGHGSRERFLTELALDPPDATSAESATPSRDEDYLVLSTIHSAKGQEWQSVSVLNVVDGCIPSDLATGSSAEIEEERRLLYVAMTRARHDLSLLVPQRFYVSHQAGLGDRHVYGGRSRFIPAELLPLFRRLAPSPQGPHAAPCADGPGPDVAAAARALWR